MYQWNDISYPQVATMNPPTMPSLLAIRTPRLSGSHEKVELTVFYSGKRRQSTTHCIKISKKCQHETFGLCPLKGSKNLHSPGWMAAPIPPVHNQTGRTGKVGSEIWTWWGAVIWIWWEEVIQIWFKLDFWWHGPIRYHYHRLLEKIKKGRKGSHRKPIPQTNRDEFRNAAQKLQYSCTQYSCTHVLMHAWSCAETKTISTGIQFAVPFIRYSVCCTIRKYNAYKGRAIFAEKWVPMVSGK